jgi:hypothetical protein
MDDRQDFRCRLHAYSLNIFSSEFWLKVWA